MPPVVQAMLVIGNVLTQMLAVAFMGGVVMVLTTVVIGLMTICTATAIKAQMILLPMSLTNNQCKQLLHMH
jgi:hypothetical protein